MDGKMKKLLTLILFMALATPAWSAIQWRNGTAETVLDGTSAANLIGYNSYNKVVQPLDNLLSTYCTEYLQYNSASIITVKAGSCVVSNAVNTVRMFMLDTSDTNLTNANLDIAGSFVAGTKYYVYSTSPNSTTQTSTYYISTSSINPSGQTYYKIIGSFTTDSSNNISTITNINRMAFGTYQIKTVGVIYQALSDGFINCRTQLNGGGGAYIYADSFTPPTTQHAQSRGGYTDYRDTLSWVVKAGDYYEGIGCGYGFEFVPLN